jgi:hypothetical protein
MKKLSSQSSFPHFGGPVGEVEAVEPTKEFTVRVVARCSEFLRVADSGDTRHDAAGRQPERLPPTLRTKNSILTNPGRQNALLAHTLLTTIFLAL